MSVRVDLHSSAAPDDVLAAIREAMREWRESALPAELRGRASQVAARIEGTAFSLFYESNSEVAPDIILRGHVGPDPSGGTRVVAGVQYSRSVWIGLALFTLIGVVLWSEGRLLALLVGAGLFGLYAWRESHRTRGTDLEAAHLVARLEQAVAAAGSRQSRGSDQAV
jgi:hypothetical protein